MMSKGMYIGGHLCIDENFTFLYLIYFIKIIWEYRTPYRQFKQS